MSCNTFSLDIYSAEFRECYKIVKYFSFGTAIVSILAVLLVFFMYWRKKSLKTFAFRFIVYLQISDGIMAFSMFLMIFDPIYHESLCKTQAFLGNYGCLSSFFWTVCISSSIYFSTIGKWKRIEKYERYFLVFSFGVPFVISLMYSLYL